jgi:hypothetical protein
VVSFPVSSSARRSSSASKRFDSVTRHPPWWAAGLLAHLP